MFTWVDPLPWWASQHWGETVSRPVSTLYTQTPHLVHSSKNVMAFSKAISSLCLLCSNPLRCAGFVSALGAQLLLPWPEALPCFLSFRVSCSYSLVRTQKGLSWLPYIHQACSHSCHPPHCNTFCIPYLPLATICKPFRLFTYVRSVSPSRVEALVVPEPHLAIHYGILSSRAVIRWEPYQILLNEWTEAEKWQDW